MFFIGFVHPLMQTTVNECIFYSGMKTRLKFLAEVSVKGQGKYVALPYTQILRDTKEFNKHFRSVKNRQASGVANQVSFTWP